MKNEAIAIRTATEDDREFVLEAAIRLGSGFVPPAWRKPEEIAAGERRTLRTFFAEPTEESSLYIAETSDGRRAGFVFLETLTDYFLDRKHGHISMLVVVEGFEHAGIGSALIATAEDWARRRGFDRLTLTVFDTNTRAKAIYDRKGYKPETLRYVKLLEREERNA